MEEAGRVRATCAHFFVPTAIRVEDTAHATVVSVLIIDNDNDVCLQNIRYKYATLNMDTFYCHIMAWKAMKQDFTSTLE